MKHLLTSFLAVLALCMTGGAADWQGEYARLLGKYVAPSGVRYADWKANPQDMAALQEVADAIAKAAPSSAKTPEQLAFYINAYNAWILHEVLERYPVKSIRDPLFTFFTSKRIVVAGTKTSFNNLEKGIILAGFKEPRAHFALNCASRSCPPLRTEPYVAAKLDAQLDEQARIFLNSELGVKGSGKSAEVSKIFDWYQSDFGGDAGVMATIRKYRKAKFDAKALNYQDYDWALNDAK
jgi:Protein of unknown function, DUF547